MIAVSLLLVVLAVWIVRWRGRQWRTFREAVRTEMSAGGPVSSVPVARQGIGPYVWPAAIWLTLSFGTLYFLVRFIKWAWTD